MNTGSFACFVFPHPILLCFLFFYLYLHLYAFFISVFCFFNARLLFLLKLRFLSHKASIFISKLHVHRFIFLLGFPSSDSSMFSFFTSICICIRFSISVFCFFNAYLLFLLKLRFWLKACRTAGHDICQGLANGSGIKGMSPHYSHDTHATNDD